MADHWQAVVALGASDCERWRDGLLHQPVNSLSSLAYVVAGIWIATRPATDRAGMVYAGAVIGNGLGSLLYHGPGWPGAAFVHDVAVPAVVLFIAVDDLALLRRWPTRRRLSAYAALLGAAGATIALAPRANTCVAALSALAAGAAEATVLIRRRRPARLVLLPAATLLIGGLLGLAGRTGSPLCHSHSPLQAHAAWHILTATALAQWSRVRKTPPMALDIAEPRA